MNQKDKGVVKRYQENQTSLKQGITYGLIIGIDNYAHCPNLYNAVKDCKDIITVLTDRFQFNKENILTLFNEVATKRNIYNAFRSLRKKITPKDNFLIYFSGHGELDKDFGVGYWIPVEAEYDAVEQFIANSDIKNILSSITSHHTFLIVDSCFSGAFFATGTGRNIHQRKERDPSRWGLTSGRNEIVTDGVPNTNSPFAQSILYQLRNADQPIGVMELCNKVLEVVSANADQTPRGEPIRINGHQGGQFVFHLKMNNANDSVTLEQTTETQKKSNQNKERKFSYKTKKIITGARKIAIQNNKSFIEITSLVLSLIENSKEIFGNITTESMNKMKEDLENNYSEPFKAGSLHIENMPLDLVSERVLKATFLEAKKFDVSEITPVHILLAILKRNDLGNIFEKYNIYYETIKNNPI